MNDEAKHDRLCTYSAEWELSVESCPECILIRSVREDIQGKPAAGGEHLPGCFWNWPCSHEDYAHEDREGTGVCESCAMRCICYQLRAAVAAARAESYNDGLMRGRYEHQVDVAQDKILGRGDAYSQGQRDALAAIQEAWDKHKRGNYHFVKCERCKGYRAACLAVKEGSDE
jgi:hypothetical protein